MAETSLVQQSRWHWHVRGAWSAREDRVPSAVWLGILWVGMIAGFGVDIPNFLHMNPPAPKMVHVHAAVFTIWLLLLSAQVLLVLRDRVALHRKLGVFAVGWAGLMAVMGPWAIVATVLRAARLHGPFPYAFIATHVVDLGGFLVLLVLGIALRKNPAAHKRIMILSTVCLADPGFNRFLQVLDKWLPDAQSPFPWFFSVFYGNLLIIFLMLAWDWRKRRLVRSHVLASAALVAAMCLASIMQFWQPWQALTLEWVKAWLRIFS